MCMFCRSVFVILSFFFWPLYCLSFFDLRILIIPFGIFKFLLTIFIVLIRIPNNIPSQSSEQGGKRLPDGKQKGIYIAHAIASELARGIIQFI